MDILPSELNITGQPIPQDVVDKMLLYHLVPMQVVRDIMGIPIWAYLKRGYRPFWFEVENGRLGGSEHTFKGLGAVDWTCTDFQKNKDDFVRNIIQHTKYTRIAIYDNFSHCDYKRTSSARREIYKSDSKSNWKFLKYAE